MPRNADPDLRVHSARQVKEKPGTDGPAGAEAWGSGGVDRNKGGSAVGTRQTPGETVQKQQQAVRGGSECLPLASSQTPEGAGIRHPEGEERIPAGRAESIRRPVDDVTCLL